MRIQQLVEGQREQIAGLRPSAPVALYHPTDVVGAANIVTQRNLPKTFMVTAKLRHAVQFGDVVVYFYGQGKNLEAPENVRKNRKDQYWAKETYPDSFNPLVSFSLLSQRSSAIYTGLINVGSIEKIYIMTDGKPEGMEPKQYLEYVLKLYGDSKRKYHS